MTTQNNTIRTIIVLSDGGTFDMADDCTVVLPNDKGQAMLEQYGDAAGVGMNERQDTVSLRALLDFYNAHNGTRF